jgi:hypothetical protein
MSHRKKTKKKGGHPKRRRVSGLSGIMHVAGQVAAAAAGGIVASFGVNAVKTAFSSQIASGSLPMWLPPLGAALTGGAIAGFVKKVPYAEEFGLGMAAVGGVMTANEMGLNIPGISGLAFGTNAAGNTLTNAIGCNKMGAGPNAYLSNTVGNLMPGRKVSPMAVASLIAN